MNDEDFFETVRQVLIPMFFKETQLGRSLKGVKLEVKKQLKKLLFESIMELANKADNETLKNEDIRKKIVEISEKGQVSIGQTQKVVNVYLKYYCILTKKSTGIIAELDCPLDSLIMSRYTTKNVRKIWLKDMTKINDYLAWQDHLKQEGKGIRLRPDIEVYDVQRIQKFYEH